VELLQEGDRLAQHSGRFSGNGPYTSLDFSDYIILDWRTTHPRDTHQRRHIVSPVTIDRLIQVLNHSEFQKLYPVVISEDSEVSILDNMLNPVENGTFRLLAS